MTLPLLCPWCLLLATRSSCSLATTVSPTLARYFIPLITADFSDSIDVYDYDNIKFVSPNDQAQFHCQGATTLFKLYGTPCSLLFSALLTRFQQTAPRYTTLTSTIATLPSKLEETTPTSTTSVSTTATDPPPSTAPSNWSNTDTTPRWLVRTIPPFLQM